ncbi:MAG: hypothetical protein U1E99_10745 [Agitococcus sp.]
MYTVLMDSIKMINLFKGLLLLIVGGGLIFLCGLAFAAWWGLCFGSVILGIAIILLAPHLLMLPLPIGLFGIALFSLGVGYITDENGKSFISDVKTIVSTSVVRIIAISIVALIVYIFSEKNNTVSSVNTDVELINEAPTERFTTPPVNNFYEEYSAPSADNFYEEDSEDTFEIEDSTNLDEDARDAEEDAF